MNNIAAGGSLSVRILGKNSVDHLKMIKNKQFAIVNNFN